MMRDFLDRFLWRYRWYRRFVMRRCVTVLSPLQVEYLKEKLQDEAVISGRDLL